VATAIADYADSVRMVHRQKIEEKASKTSIKMLFPVILCLAPPIYILLCGPPMLKLRNFIIEGHQPGGVLNTPTDIGSLNSTDNAVN
jgi:tight adherence protein C